jgi:hypothetical protein
MRLHQRVDRGGADALGPRLTGKLLLPGFEPAGPVAALRRVLPLNPGLRRLLSRYLLVQLHHAISSECGEHFLLFAFHGPPLCQRFSLRGLLCYSLLASVTLSPEAAGPTTAGDHEMPPPAHMHRPRIRHIRVRQRHV